MTNLYKMNLHQINAGINGNIIKSAKHDILIYIDFIQKAIALLEKQSFVIEVTKSTINAEIRYEPIDNQKDKRNKKAIEMLFNENTKVVFENNKDFNRRNGIEIEKNVEENYFIAEKEIQGNKIYLQPDTYQLQKQKQALETLLNQPLSTHTPLLKLFGYQDDRQWNGFQINPINNNEWFILTDQTKDGVNEQRNFVKKALTTPDFALLEGPPGSGKTTTIIEIIMQLAKQGKRILLCSATHAAIDNVIERITERYKAICETQIVPVRISRDKKAVKENVQPYLLQNLSKTYKENIKNFLKDNQVLESQQFLFKNIDYQKDSQKNNNFIEQIILESANLVCGTNVGILQHPTIKGNQQGASFDVLIVDESSKVTFQDFIIPALHAKKWILVGDTKQLSPYVEDDYVAENLNTLIDEKTQKHILQQFELRQKLADKKYEKQLKIYFSDDIEKEKFDFFDTDTSLNDLIVTKITNDFKKEQNILINASDVLICENSKEVKKIISDNLFVAALFFNDKPSDLGLKFRQDYFHKNNYNKYQNNNNQKDRQPQKWADMLASKISQDFSFRNAGNEFENIKKELSYLTPNEISKEVNEIKRLVFPSILEMLQNGVGKTQGQTSNKVISNGLSENAKKDRFESLTFQHRMHPDIATTSRENFYTEFDNLKPANTVLEDRNWHYATNENAVKWVSNNDATSKKIGKIINPTEVKDIEYELKKFCDWAKDNPKIENGKNILYEVAVLTFYLEQERELRKMLRKFTNQMNNFAKFDMPNVKIFLYTVDKFQGQEADLVLLGFTKTSANAFYNSPNRLNVALTRARHKLILFGNTKWFQQNAKLKALRDLATNFSATIKIT